MSWIRPQVAAGLALLVAAGCVGDVGEGKVKADVQDVPTEAAPRAGAEGTELAIDASKSKLSALGAKITAKHPIVFHRWSGSVHVDGDTVNAVAFEVDVASLESDNKRLDAHLMKEDFLHTEVYPKATFASTAVVAGSDADGATHTVTGDLTIRGATKRVTFPAKITVGADAVAAEAEFTIDRQDFKVTYPGSKDDLVQDNVVMTIAFVAPRGA